jgi:hypothetical protein
MLSHPFAFRLLALLSTIALGATLFWGYCWGWVPALPIVMFIFHPHCPDNSEESRYPTNVDVLVSSRYKPFARFSAYLLPGGETLLYDNGDNFTLYDLETKSHQRILFPEEVAPSAVNTGGSSMVTVAAPMYITDEWVLIKGRYGSTWDWSMLTLETQQTVRLETIKKEIHLADGIPADLEPIIRQASAVYIVRGNLILVPTYLGDTSATPIIIEAYTTNYMFEDGENIAAHVRELGIEPVNPTSIYTPDRRFYFSPTDVAYRGRRNPVAPVIVDAQSNQPIVEFNRANYEPIGWAAGQHGVVLQATERTVLGWAIWLFAEVNHPILLLRQAPEYLTPDQQAKFAAQDAQEAEAKRYPDRVMALLTVTTVTLLGFTLRSRRPRFRAPVQQSAP